MIGADELPYFRLAGAAHEVSRLVAVNDWDSHAQLGMGAVDDRFGL